MSLYASPKYATHYLDWVKGLLPEDKFYKFCSLMRFPVKSNELTEQIFAALEKIFDGKNAVYEYLFASPNEAKRWDDYRAGKAEKMWRETGMKMLRCAPNSVMIVDIDDGKPYTYFLDISNVLDFETEEDTAQMKYIVFRVEGGNLAVFDDDAMQVYDFTDDELGQEPVSVFQHNLGYCPARFFLTKGISQAQPEVKESPLTRQLGDLDWYLFFAMSERHLDLYGAYPIYWGFTQDCDYQAPHQSREGFVYCDKGFLRHDISNEYLFSRSSREHGQALVPCPACSKKKLAGAGSFVEVPPPGMENDNADLRDPVGIVSVDRASLDYVADKREAYKREIYQATTGYGGEPVNDQAVNEKQVVASFESRAQVLRNLKRQFEMAQQWAESTLARLMFGDRLQSVTINYGTEFYLHEASELFDMYQTAKKAGLDDKVLDMLHNEYYETKYKNNASELRRIKILSDLDPFRHLDKNQVQGMYQQGQIEYVPYMLKMNFSTLVARFERENGNLQMFGQAVEYRTKIERIQSTLESYIQQPAADAAQNNDDE